MKNITLILVIASAVIVIGCGEGVKNRTAVANAQPVQPISTPTPVYSPAEIEQFNKTIKELTIDTDLYLYQIANTDGWDIAVCTAMNLYDKARDLEKEAYGPNRETFAKQVTETARTSYLVEKNLISFGKVTAKTGAMTDVFPYCSKKLKQTDKEASLLSIVNALYMVKEGFNEYRLDIQETGLSAEQFRRLALQRSKQLAGFIVQDMRDPELKTEDTTPLQEARKSWKEFSNPWKFTIEELGVRYKDYQTLTEE